MILKTVEVNKYKCIQTPQVVDIQPDITTLVGMNESGKTAFLEALAKVNYFIDDPKFKLDETFDYPRKELKQFQKSDEDVQVVKCVFEITDKLKKKIEDVVGEKTYVQNTFEYAIRYDKSALFPNATSNFKEFINFIIVKYEIDGDDKEKIQSLLPNFTNIDALISSVTSENTIKMFNFLKEEIKENALDWENVITGYIIKKWLMPNMPKFWYYDEYYSLPSRIDLNLLKNNQIKDKEALNTSQALLELADIDIDSLLQSNNFEKFIAELEATSSEITEQMLKYWSSNNNLEIQFKIDTVSSNKILDIRIYNQKHRVSLPLNKRSKGFNWFFSFIVWFSKVQADKSSKFILLLDEPGLNLHASAQADLLRFLNDLSVNYQIVYSTHSPFMIESNHLERVRTVVEKENGTAILDSIQEKDPNTLFPLQAALGYDIAQNLFISPNNLLVEGPADLIYLTMMSNLLESNGRTGLKEGVTIVPVGGLDKVTTFISLLRGSKLNVVCLLDSFRDAKGKEKVEDLVKDKIIKDRNIRFFDEFVKIKGGKADIEDVFSKSEYIKMFNSAFPEHGDIELDSLDSHLPCILQQICKYINVDRFNHYKPANKLALMGVDNSFFSIETLERFDNLYKTINSLF